MKKLIAMAFVALMPLCFIACGNNPEVRIESEENIEQFYTGTLADYSEYIDGNITYNSLIQNEMQNSESEYYALNYYEKILNMTLFNANKLYSTFEVSPVQNQSQSDSLCITMQRKLILFTQETADFENLVDGLIYSVNTYGVTNPLALSDLKTFKQGFAELIYKANDFNMAFTKAYTTLYGGYVVENFDSQNVLNAVYDQFALLVDNYIQYALVEFNGIHPAENNYYLSLEKLFNKLESTVETENYLAWVEIKKLFDSELKMFNEALSKIDLTKDNSELEGKNLVYLNKINSFVESNAQIFIDKTRLLFS